MMYTFHACVCSRQLHFGRLLKFSNFPHDNHPLQMHALNAAHVNYPIHLSVFNRIDVVHVFEIRDVVTWAQRASRRTKHVI